MIDMLNKTYLSLVDVFILFALTDCYIRKQYLKEVLWHRGLLLVDAISV